MYTKRITLNKKTIAAIIIFAALALVVGVLLFANAHHAYAAAGDTKLEENQSDHNGWWQGIKNVGGKVLAVLGDATIGNVFLFFTWAGYSMFSLLLTLSGILLDNSVTLSLDSSNFTLPAISAAWIVIRDFANLFFIFILLYIAIATILNLGNYKRALLSVIIGALLINFSLFFTKVVIDAGNILAVGFYNEASAVTVKGIPGHSLSLVFSEGLKLQSMMDTSSYEKLSNFNSGKAYLFGTIVESVAMFVFFSAALMFIGRTIALMFLMVLSPFVFVAMVLPGTKGQAAKWWRTLISQVFFAPAFLFFVWIVAEIIKRGELVAITGSGNSSFADLVNMENVDDASLFLTYFLICGLLLGSLTVAKSMGGAVASTSVTWAKKLTGANMAKRKGRQLGKKVGKWATTQTAGRAASRIANSQTLKNFGMDHPTMGRMADSALGAAGATNYDKWADDNEAAKKVYGNKIAKRDTTPEERKEVNFAHEERESSEKAYTAKVQAMKDAEQAWQKDMGNDTLRAQAEQARSSAERYGEYFKKTIENEKKVEETVTDAKKSYAKAIRERVAGAYERKALPTSRIGKVVVAITGQARMNWNVAEALRAGKTGKEGSIAAQLQKVLDKIKAEEESGAIDTESGETETA